jgi:hypothetical protein
VLYICRSLQVSQVRDKLAQELELVRIVCSPIHIFD